MTNATQLFKSTLLLAMLTIIGTSAFAQGRTITQKADKGRKTVLQHQEQCGSDQLHQYKLSTDPTYKKSYDKAQLEFDKALLENNSQRGGGGTIYTIPVVVHIMHRSGISVGTDENITQAQIESAITALNEDFRKETGTNGDGDGVDIEIEFCLATKDTGGNATTGINRIAVSLGGYDTVGVDYSGAGNGPTGAQVRALSNWDHTKYYNMWIVWMIDGSNGGGIQGFAYFPGAGNGTDGTMILHNAFGTTGNLKSYTNKNRTATHEMGHALNLYHTFQGGCTNTDCTTDGDKVCDTPPTTQNSGCSVVTPCGDTALVENYMDYTNQNCKDMFTQGQADRMRAVMTSTRASLTTSANLSATGCDGTNAPSTRFTVSDSVPCFGVAITYTDESLYLPTSWNWTFAGGSPATDTVQNPSVTYSTTGPHDVTLIATNGFGSDTLTKTSYISPIAPSSIPIAEDFESATFPPTNWTITPDSELDSQDEEWERNTDAGGFGNSTASARIPNNSAQNTGFNEMNTEPMDFSSTTSPTMTFDVAYERYWSNYTDTLRIYYSLDCGSTFDTTLLYEKGYGDLYTSQGAVPPPGFIPSSSEWRTETVDLSALAGQANVTIQFQRNEKPSNSLYIDNVNIFDELTVNIVGTNVSCNGSTDGAADATAGGGFAPYTYLWDNGDTTEDLSSISSGTYVLTVTDTAGNTAVDNITITEPNAITTSYSITNVSCNGGSDGAIDMTVSNGVSPYAFIWSNTDTTEDITGLAQGTYLVTITDNNGCQLIDSATVTEPTTLTASVAGNNISCNGIGDGSLDLTAAGGSGPYSYNWSNGDTLEDQSSLGTGTYLVTVTDSLGCTVVDSGTLTEPTAIITSIVGTDASCFSFNDGAADLTVSGGLTPYSYLWSNAATTQDIGSLTANTYIVTVTDSNACTAEDTIVVSEPTDIVVTSGVSDATCGNSDGYAFVSVSGGNPTYTYLWSDAQTNDTAFGLNANAYSVTITDNDLCTDSASVVINDVGAPSLGFGETEPSCPTATDGSINLVVTGPFGPFSYIWSNGDTIEDPSGLGQGAYNVTVTDTAGCVSTGGTSLTDPSPVSISISGTDVSCGGGSDGAADLTPGGGNPGYSYLWSNTDTTQDISGLILGTYLVTVTDTNSCQAIDSVVISEPTPFTTGVVGTDALCNGNSNGIGDLTVSGGNPPYTFIWTNGTTTEDATNLNAGTHFVTITDSLSCSTVDSVTIGEPITMTTTASDTDISCLGGSDGIIDLEVFGGTAPYSYSWTPTGDTTQDLSGLGTGTYTVIATDTFGCMASRMVIITEPATAVNITSMIGVNPSCAAPNGSINMSLTGGTPGYTYLWSNGATTQDISGLSTGTYVVTATDANGCTDVDSATLGGATLLSTFITETGITCNGDDDGSVDLLVAGGQTPYTYLWSTGATTEDVSSLTPGTHYVTVTDNNSCLTIDSGVIIEPAVINLTFAKTNPTCAGALDGTIDLTVTGGTTPYTYSWSSGQTSEDLSGIGGGIYFVTVTDDHGCSKVGVSVLVDPSTTINTTIVGTDETCFGSADGVCDLTASGGVPAYIYSWSTGATTQDITSVSAGTYYVSVTDQGGCLVIDTVLISSPSALTTSIIGTDAGCSGASDGAADLTASGSYNSFTYLWSTGATTEDIGSLGAGSYYVTVTDTGTCEASDTVVISQGSAFSFTTTAADDSCGASVGSAIVSVSGGAAPYTYLWNNGQTDDTATALVSGLYTVVVTANDGCVDSTTVIINDVGAPTLSSSSTDVSCFGLSDGTIDLTVVGGSLPYSYVWSNADTNQDLSALSAATYSVTVTDGATCAAVELVTINEPPAVTASVAGTDISCNGLTDGSADLSPGGGSGPFTFNWAHGPITEDVSALSQGTYYVTVTDSLSCTINDSVSITEPTALAHTLSSTDINCFAQSDGTADLTVSGGTIPYTYAWSNGETFEDVSSLGAGTFLVTVTDNRGCNLVDSVTITEPSAVTSSLVGTNILCNSGNNGAIDLTPGGGVGGYTYLWNNLATTQDINTLTAATYWVRILDANSCILYDTLALTEPTALSTTVVGTDISCNTLTDGSADLTAGGGETPYVYSWSHGPVTEDVNALAEGTFYVTVTDSNLCTIVDSAVIVEPSAITSSIVGVDATCALGADGTADLTVGGGTPGFTYSWSSGANTEDASALAANTYYVTMTDINLCQHIDSVVIGEPAITTATTTATSVSCFGDSDGSVDLTVTFGKSPFTYAWSNGPTTEDISNVASGNYTVSITDSVGCQITKLQFVPTPFTLITNTSGTDASCNNLNDGMIDLQVTWGVPAYNFAWSNGDSVEDPSGLLAGLYAVTVTDQNGCQAFDNQSISEPPAQNFSLAQTNVSCFGLTDGTSTATPVGGSPPYSYTWSNGQNTQTATNLDAITYIVTVSDGFRCSLDSVSITEPTVLTDTVVGVDISCFGDETGTATVTASGGTPTYTYLWSNGQTTATATGLAAGAYNVTTTDSKNCTSSDGIIISQNDSLFASVRADSATFGTADGKAWVDTVHGGTPAYTYLWSNGGTTDTIKNLAAGVYTLTVSDAEGCSRVLDVTVFERPLEPGIAINEIDFNVRLYPNPVLDNLQLSYTAHSAHQVEIRIHNLLGEQIYRSDLGVSKKLKRTIDMTEYPSGVYLIKMRVGESEISRKIVLSK